MRTIRVASVSFLMEDEPHTIEFNLERAADYIRKASAAGAQIVCLPETVTTNRVDGDLVSVDAKWTEYFSKAARKNSIAVVAPFYFIEAGATFNQATVFNADGKQIGFYRKAQPTGHETKWITPGSEFPILDLGFAKIAIMICMDIYFPEIALIYAMKGAEILFWPTTTHGPSQSGLLAQLQSRAID
ncbi:MAG TPA: carbon-nitrogen hydrolase family protein, partial [Candidatus Kapabacteria bacterium]|nr:carbon-nitrogen hydrolase family protein [Candidatus Kapabacteria bacterium]